MTLLDSGKIWLETRQIWLNSCHQISLKSSIHILTGWKNMVELLTRFNHQVNPIMIQQVSLYACLQPLILNNPILHVFLRVANEKLHFVANKGIWIWKPLEQWIWQSGNKEHSTLWKFFEHLLIKSQHWENNRSIIQFTLTLQYFLTRTVVRLF